MTNKVEASEIINLLPHRYPFLLVDCVLKIEPSQYILAKKNVTVNEPFFSGHFPTRPIMPGVLIIEALAQAAGLLFLKSGDTEVLKKHIYFLAGIDKARFKSLVQPGDELYLEIEVLQIRGKYKKFSGVARVDDRVACDANLILY